MRATSTRIEKKIAPWKDVFTIFFIIAFTQSGQKRKNIPLMKLSKPIKLSVFSHLNLKFSPAKLKIISAAAT